MELEWSTWFPAPDYRKLVKGKHSGVYEIAFGNPEGVFFRAYIGKANNVRGRLSEQFRFCPDEDLDEFSKPTSNADFFEQLTSIIPRKYWSIRFAYTDDQDNVETKLIQDSAGLTTNVRSAGPNAFFNAKQNANQILDIYIKMRITIGIKPIIVKSLERRYK